MKLKLQVRIKEFGIPRWFQVLADLEYPCILGVDIISGSEIVIDFFRKSLAIPYSQIEKAVTTIDEGNLEIDLSKTGLEERQKHQLQDLFNSFKGLFSDKPVLTHVLYHEIDMGDTPLVISRLNRYNSDVVKTTFGTKNVTYAFKRLPFGLSGEAPNFPKTLDIVLKPVIRRFENLHMDAVIITPLLFAHHVKHLIEAFRLLQEARLTLNNDKCKFGCDKLKYLGLVISKDGIITEETKVKAIMKMSRAKNSKKSPNVKQLMEEQRKNPELGHIYRYLENPEDSSVDATICENWSRDFRLIEGLLHYAKSATTLREM
ncbi:retrovirus-related Pol polyprotein from transposon 17.6 [Trichonephila clavipes]|nr:retrovirus-related Pol polyprotein from transposon 17.6 [Trichonephila clavipes]